MSGRIKKKRDWMPALSFVLRPVRRTSEWRSCLIKGNAYWMQTLQSMTIWNDSNRFTLVYSIMMVLNLKLHKPWNRTKLKGKGSHNYNRVCTMENRLFTTNSFYFKRSSVWVLITTVSPKSVLCNDNKQVSKADSNLRE